MDYILTCISFIIDRFVKVKLDKHEDEFCKFTTSISNEQHSTMIRPVSKGTKFTDE